MIEIRTFEPADAEKIVSWINNSLSFYQWSAGRFGEYPMTPQRLADYYADKDKSDGAMPFTAYDEQGIAGHFIIRFLDEEKKKARLGFIVVDSARRGQNLGGRMLALAEGYCRDVLKADNMSLGVFKNNPAAIRCYEKVGLTPCGEYTAVVNGEEWEAILMEKKL